MHAAAPAITRCDRRELVAIDPAAPAIDHHVTVRGRIRCTNCGKTTLLEVRLGDAAVGTDARGRFAIDATASGVLELEVRDRGFSSAASVKRIDFGRDRAVELGTLRVKVPEMAPGED